MNHDYYIQVESGERFGQLIGLKFHELRHYPGVCEPDEKILTFSVWTDGTPKQHFGIPVRISGEYRNTRVLDSHVEDLKTKVRQRYENWTGPDDPVDEAIEFMPVGENQLAHVKFGRREKSETGDGGELPFQVYILGEDAARAGSAEIIGEISEQSILSAMGSVSKDIGSGRLPDLDQSSVVGKAGYRCRGEESETCCSQPRVEFGEPADSKGIGGKSIRILPCRVYIDGENEPRRHAIELIGDATPGVVERYKTGFLEEIRTGTSLALAPLGSAVETEPTKACDFDGT